MALPPATLTVLLGLAIREPPVAVAAKITVPAAPALTVNGIFKVSALDPPTEKVIVAAPPPVSETAPVPDVLIAPVLCTFTEPTASDDVSNPLSANVPPLTFAVIEAVELSVAPLATPISPPVAPTDEVVIVTPPVAFKAMLLFAAPASM